MYDYNRASLNSLLMTVTVEFQKPQMARVVSVKHLEGLPVGGPDTLLFDFTLLDPFFAVNDRQRFRFGVSQGRLTVRIRTEETDATTSQETELDIRGLTSLIYGVIKSIDEIELKNWITFSKTPDGAKAAKKAIKALFPPMPKPLMFENF